MKLDVRQVLLDLDGEPILVDYQPLLDEAGKVKTKDGRPEFTGGKPMTFARAAIDALMAVHEDEKNLSGEQKLERFELAARIKNAHLPVELSPTEVNSIKELVNKTYLGPIIYARVVEAIKAADKPVVVPVKDAAE